MEKEEKNSGWIVISTAETAHDSGSWLEYDIPNARYSHIAAYTLMLLRCRRRWQWQQTTMSTAITLWRIGMRENGSRDAEKEKKHEHRKRRQRRQQQQQRSVCEPKLWLAEAEA